MKLRIDVTSDPEAIYDWKLRVITAVENVLKTMSDVWAFRIEIDENMPIILVWSREVTRT